MDFKARLAVLAAALWWGSLCAIGFVAVPLLFAHAGSPAIAGPLAGKLFSAHQMGTARMGVSPRTSVAAPTGEVYGARGVWIGDTSAFPSAVGSNPMITCQALARRTARMIARG